jgi:hypothetical protein
VEAADAAAASEQHRPLTSAIGIIKRRRCKPAAFCIFGRDDGSDIMRNGFMSNRILSEM